MTRYALAPVIFLAFVAVSYGQVPQHAHVVIVVEENHGYSSVIGTTAMPYLNSLISQYGLATNYYADTHPSIGNYFMLTTGQIITNNDGYVPPTGGLDVDNIVRQLLLAGKTWKVYAEDLPSVGYIGGDSGLYSKHHNPFVYLSDVVGSSTQLLNVVPFTQFPTDLANNQVPDYSFIVPNLCNDAHDCSLTIADNWLQTNIAPLVSSPTFQQNGLLLILFDEANSSDLTNGGGHIVWTAVGPKVKAAYKSATFFQHESTLKLSMEALGINSGFPGAAASAPQMTEFFTLLNPFFGMHETNAALHGWPPVPFGSFRIWDTFPSVTWRDINTASGVYNWTDLDNLAMLAQSHGADLVYTFGKTPAWASSNPSGSCGNNDAGSCYAPASQSDWTAFVTAITSRYAGKIKYWELWNEPNASNFWAGTTAELEVMAQNAYPIIKAADSGSLIAFGSRHQCLQLDGRLSRGRRRALCGCDLFPRLSWSHRRSIEPS